MLRDLTERVVIASKGRFDRALSRPARQERGLPSQVSLTEEEFIEATTDVWELPSERATRVGHPAPFPLELPLRLIELYTYEGDLVLDPFIGSGTTAAAAVRSRRHYVGYDTESEYVRIAEQRVSRERDALIEREDLHASARRDGDPGARHAGELLRAVRVLRRGAGQASRGRRRRGLRGARPHRSAVAVRLRGRLHHHQHGTATRRDAVEGTRQGGGHPHGVARGPFGPAHHQRLPTPAVRETALVIAR